MGEITYSLINSAMSKGYEKNCGSVDFLGTLRM